MRNFLRGVRNSWPYRTRLFLSVAFAILAAAFWSLNFLAIHPVMKILGGVPSLAESVDKDIGQVEEIADPIRDKLASLREELRITEELPESSEKDQKKRDLVGHIA